MPRRHVHVSPQPRGRTTPKHRRGDDRPISVLAGPDPRHIAALRRPGPLERLTGSHGRHRHTPRYRPKRSAVSYLRLALLTALLFLLTALLVDELRTPTGPTPERMGPALLEETYSATGFTSCCAAVSTTTARAVSGPPVVAASDV